MSSRAMSPREEQSSSTKYTSTQVWIPVGIDGNGYYQDYNEWKNEVTYQ
jgi:hypothetical protein